MTDTDGPATISPEAHQRVVSERDQLKQQVTEKDSLLAQANKAVATANATVKYLEHRASTDDAVKPFVAELQIATPMLDGIDAEKLDDAVKSVADTLSSFRSGGPVVADQQVGDLEPPAAAPNTQTPAQIPQPNPGADGSHARPETLDIQGRARLAQEGGTAALKAAIESGEIKLDPQVLNRER